MSEPTIMKTGEGLAAEYAEGVLEMASNPDKLASVLANIPEDKKAEFQQFLNGVISAAEILVGTASEKGA